MLLQWLARRADYIADTTLERRQAEHERVSELSLGSKLRFHFVGFSETEIPTVEEIESCL